MFQLLLSAYSTISIQDAALFLGMNEADATNCKHLLPKFFMTVIQKGPDSSVACITWHLEACTSTSYCSNIYYTETINPVNRVGLFVMLVNLLWVVCRANYLMYQYDIEGVIFGHKLWACLLDSWEICVDTIALAQISCLFLGLFFKV